VVQKEWLFDPLDTLFFRGGLSIDAGETGYVESIFPPHPQTMQGVVRSAVILSHCKDPDFSGFGKCDTCGEKKCPLPEAIGSPKEGSYGALDVYGPYLYKEVNEEGNRYFPAPLNLMREKEGDERLFSLVPGKAVSCDLGNVYLPANPENGNYKPFEAAGGWIWEDALLRYLKDKKMPARDELLAEEEFYVKEPKAGIEREYATRKVKTGMLYSIVPLRFKEDVKIGLRVNGIAKELEPKGFATKIGGEGRICGLEIKDYGKSTDKLHLKNRDRIRLVLLQPADFDGKWRPSSLQEKQQSDKTTCWEGKIDGINGVTLRLISACIGRQQKIGGWDMVKKAVKPMRSYVPAGSVYFFEVINNSVSEIPAEGKIGENTKIGLGHYLLGRW
jgi:CRISPR-associated protein Cmr3